MTLQEMDLMVGEKIGSGKPLNEVRLELMRQISSMTNEDRNTLFAKSKVLKDWCSSNRHEIEKIMMEELFGESDR